MKSKKKKAAKFLGFSVTTLLWVGAIFFLIGGLTYFDKSVLAAILMLLLGLVLLPPTWRLVKKQMPKIATTKIRVALGIVLLLGAVMVSPTDQAAQANPQKAAETETITKPQPKPKAETKITTPKAETVTQNQALADVTFQKNEYRIKGTGLAKTNYILQFSSGNKLTVATDKKGNFSAVLSPSKLAFGSVELTRDTNGAWPGGHKTYDTLYFVLNKQKTAKSDKPLKPVALALSGSSSQYKIAGLYTPGSKLLLKTGNTTLATTKVDKTGHYTFSKISLKSNYTKVALYKKVSTGWLSSKNEKVSADNYLDTQTKHILAALPITQKQETSTEVIAFTSKTVQSASMNQGETRVTQAGVNGERTIVYNVTYKGDQQTNKVMVSDTVTKQPVEQVTTVGTYVAPVYVAPAASSSQASTGVRTGARCADGWHSSATGRGACSHHGGVAEWLYS